MGRRSGLTTLLNSVLGRGTSLGLTDGELVERFAFEPGEKGDVAFAALMDRHSRMVYRTCWGILCDDHEALDATQATFLILFRKGASLRVAGSLGPWLHRVACRVAHRLRREAGRRQAIERHLLAAHCPGPTGPTGPGDRLYALHEELDRLPERLRVPIILCDLEGHTCASAAEQVGCPVGTVASRLARGRAQLRGRLARRGLDPAVDVLALAFPRESTAVSLLVAPRVAAASPAIARLSRDVIRSLVMSQFKSIGVAAACSLGLLAGWSYRGTHAQEPANPPAFAAQPQQPDREPLINDPERHNDYIMAEIGNMPPLVTTKRGVAFSSREAVVYKDGTAKLWSLYEKEPVAPPLRHEKPIRNMTFFDQATLLVTLSDDEVRLWNGLTGELRQALPGQTITPLWSNLSDRSGRFLTLDLARKVITVRDWNSLEVVGTMRSANEVSAAVLAPGGQTVAAFHLNGEATTELWDISSGRLFATIRPPSSALRGILIEGDLNLDRAALVEHDATFWDVVRTLAPAAIRAKN